MLRTFPKQPAADDFSVADLVTVLLHKVMADAEAELERAAGATGRVLVSLEVSLVDGKPRWSSTSLHFAEHQQYGKESIVR